jgi:hypothetical protein
MRIRRTASSSLSLAFLIPITFLISSGCGNSERVVPIHGLVTHNGQPVAGLVVSFVPEAATETGVSTGQTDDNGRYDLKVVKSGKSGAVVGTHKVWVSKPRPPLEAVEKDKEERAKEKKMKTKRTTERPPPDFAAILKKYGSLDKSTLIIEVKNAGAIDLPLD